MSEKDDPVEKRPLHDATHENMLSIGIHGRDSDTWGKRGPRFVERIFNSFRSLFSGDVRPEVTANTELLDTADALAKEVLNAPQLRHLEKQLSIKLKMAEIKEREANARKVGLEADKLEMEIEREQVLKSQKLIELAIKRGELIPVVENGELVLIYKKREL